MNLDERILAFCAQTLEPKTAYKVITNAMAKELSFRNGERINKAPLMAKLQNEGNFKFKEIQKICILFEISYVDLIIDINKPLDLYPLLNKLKNETA